MIGTKKPPPLSAGCSKLHEMTLYESQPSLGLNPRGAIKLVVMRQAETVLTDEKELEWGLKRRGPYKMQPRRRSDSGRKVLHDLGVTRWHPLAVAACFWL